MDNPQRQPPAFTLRNVCGDVVSGVRAVLVSPSASRAVAPAVVCIASIVCKVVAARVKYTEIDFSTYMQQVELVSAGARDYSAIAGDSGPIVYPAGFVQVYQALAWLTEGGVHLQRAQRAFGYLFTATVMLTCVVYCAVGGLPPWTLYLLLCSRRLYSIYVLRMFNDCFTAAGMVAVVLLLQQAANWSRHLSATMMFLLCAVAADVYSMALSVKMNVLLYLPAFVVVVYFLLGENLLALAGVLAVIPAVQVVIGWRFLLPLFWDEEASYLRNMYLSRAFDFSRKFLHKWTVNWRFVAEDIFSSDEFALALLALHAAALLFFAFTRFLSPKLTGKSLVQLVKDAVLKPMSRTASPANLLLQPTTGPRLVMLIFAVTNLIGVLFARSLHYQFLAWYAWSLPFLFYAADFHMVTAVVVFAAHEWCWNMYPSTNESSQLLVSILLITLVAIWANTDFWFTAKAGAQEKKTAKVKTAEKAE